MPQDKTRSGLIWSVVALGAVWGLSEAGLGLALAACAKSVSGSIMTGAAIFFLSAARVRARSSWGPALAVALAVGTKLFDAALLGRPIGQAVVANPTFALIVEGIWVATIFSLFGRRLEARKSTRAWLGAGGGLAASGLFLLAPRVTGMPVCLFGATSWPLAVVFAPVAAAAGAVAMPLAFSFVAGLEARELRLRPAWRIVLPLVASALSLLGIAVLRLV